MPSLRHPVHREHGQAPVASAVFAVSAPVEDRLVVVDSRGGDDFASFAEVMPGPVVVCVDEIAELFGQIEVRRALALAQRTEIHVGLDDELLGDLAARAVYPRRSWWRRILTAAATFVGTGVRP